MPADTRHVADSCEGIRSSRTPWMVGGLCALFLLPFLVLSIYAVPVGDDYTYLTGEFSVEAVSRHVTTGRQLRGGLYTSAALRYICATSIGNAHYWLIPAGAQLLLFLGILTVVGVWLKKWFNAGERFATAVLLYTVFMTQMPAPEEYVYWATGAICYVPGTVLYLVILALLHSVVVKGEMGRCKCFVLALLCSIAAGTHFVFLLAILATLFFVTIRAFAIRSDARMRMLFLLLFATAFGLFVISAPGNFIRSDAAQQRSIGLRSPVIAGLGLRFLCEWLTSGLAVGLTLLVTGVLARSPTWRRPDRRCVLWVLCLSAAYVAVFFAVCFLTAIGGFRVPPGRVLDVLYLLFILFFPVGAAYLLLASNFGKMLAEVATQPVFQNVVLLFVLGCLLGQGNFQFAVLDLTHRAPDFKRQHEARNESIIAQRQAGVRDVRAPVLHDPPWVSYYGSGEITEDPSVYSNVNMARLFKVDSVMAADEGPDDIDKSGHEE